MRHDPGLAASPPVRYILEVERSGCSSFHSPSAAYDIHLSAWKDNSRKFTCRILHTSAVRSAMVTGLSSPRPERPCTLLHDWMIMPISGFKNASFFSYVQPC